MNAEQTTSRAGARRRGRRRRAAPILVGMAALVVLAAVAAVGYLASLSGTFDTKTNKIASAFPDDSVRPPAADPQSEPTPVNVLMIGSDSRGAALGQAEAGQPSDQRADTIMLVHIPADRKKVYAISIMRDLWITIPGHGPAKVNASLAEGGVPLVVQTIEGLLHQRIDHVVAVDFDGFKGLTDALGGVDVDVPVAFSSTMYENRGLAFQQGPLHMDGRTAFAFIHERYAFSDGDYQRVRNQQVYLKSLFSKVFRPETLADPMTASAALGAFAPYLAVDAGLTSGAVASLALQLSALRPADVVTLTLPTLGTGWSEDGQSIVRPDPKATDALAVALAGGTMDRFATEARAADR